MTESPKTIGVPKPDWNLHRERPAVQLVAETVRVAEKIVLPASLINLAHRPDKMGWAAFKMDSGLLAEVGGYLTVGPALMSGNPEAIAGSLTALLLGKAQAIEGGAMARKASRKTGVEHDPAILQWTTMAITEGVKTVLPAVVSGRELRDRLGLYRLTQEALKYAMDLPALGMIGYGVLNQDQTALAAGITMYGTSRLLERTVEFAEDHPDSLTKRGKQLAKAGMVAGTVGLRVARRVSAERVAQAEATIKKGVTGAKKKMDEAREAKRKFREWDEAWSEEKVYRPVRETAQAAGKKVDEVRQNAAEARQVLADRRDKMILDAANAFEKNVADPLITLGAKIDEAKGKANAKKDEVAMGLFERGRIFFDKLFRRKP